MILDKENLFALNQTLSGAFTSDVIKNGNGGSAESASWLYVNVNSTLSDNATVALKTADNEGMTTNVKTVATYILNKDAGSTIDARLPVGLSKYLRLDVSGATSGSITAGLVFDTQINH